MGCCRTGRIYIADRALAMEPDRTNPGPLLRFAPGTARRHRPSDETRQAGELLAIVRALIGEPSARRAPHACTRPCEVAWAECERASVHQDTEHRWGGRMLKGFKQ